MLVISPSLWLLASYVAVSNMLVSPSVPRKERDLRLDFACGYRGFMEIAGSALWVAGAADPSASADSIAATQIPVSP
jgi:hypothetical protein